VTHIHFENTKKHALGCIFIRVSGIRTETELHHASIRPHWSTMAAAEPAKSSFYVRDFTNEDVGIAPREEVSGAV
jgi:hypothetical protein